MTYDGCNKAQAKIKQTMKARAKNPILLLALIISLGFILASQAMADGVIHYIIGYVRDTAGNPVVGLSVTGDDYVGDDLPFIPTDANGNYLVDGGTEGNYQLKISCDQLAARGFACIAPVAVSISSEYTEVNFILTPALFQVTNAFILPRGNVGMAYNAQLGAIGGQEPYSWQLAAGSTNLPPGLSLNSSGLISGTPLTNYASSLKVQVMDANFMVTNKSLSIIINPKPVLSAPLWITNRFLLRLTGATNQNYTIQMTTNLSFNNWTSLLITNNLRTNSFIVADPRATNQARFYRVLIGP